MAVLFRRVRAWVDDDFFGHWHPATETCVVSSADGGASWTQPRVIFAGHQCPCLTRLRTGEWIYHTHRTHLVNDAIVSTAPDHHGAKRAPWPGLHGGTFVQRSTDEGLTWTEPVYLDGVPGVEPLHASLPIPVGVRGNVLELADRRLMVSAYTQGPNVTHLFVSSNQGATWSHVTAVADGFNEAYLHEMPSGALHAYLRKEDREGVDDWTILHVTESRDGGLTWSEPKALFKGYPSGIVPFGSGNLCLLYGYRMDEAWGIRARRLSPEGDVLDEPELVIRDDGAVRDLGYSHAATLSDDRVFAVYYINRKADAPDGTAPRYIESAIISESYPFSLLPDSTITL